MTKSNIFKKIAAGIISLSVIIGAVPVMAEESVDQDTTGASLIQDYEAELLTKLGIVDEEMLKLADEDLSRGAFADMLAGLMGMVDAESGIQELYNLGIVSGYGDGDLKQSQTITTYEAIKMVIGALGYATYSELNGGFPIGYVRTAYDVNLLSGAIQNENMTYAEGIRLILDTGNANTAAVQIDSLPEGLNVGGETMFYRYFDIMKVEGILTANGITSLDGRTSAENEVIIAGNAMLAGETEAQELIGYYVDAYCYDREFDDELISIMPSVKYNNEVKVSAGTYVNATTGGSELAFTFMYENDNGRVVEVDVEDYYVIKNGERYGSFVRSELDNSLADVTLIDNDKDNKYEVIIIEQYETYVVQSVNPDKFEVYAKYDKVLAMDPEEKTVTIIKSSGKTGAFKDISAGTALSVLKSQSGNVIKAYILGKTVSGLVAGLSTEGSNDVVTIDGNKYVISAEYRLNTHADRAYPILGSSINAFLDLKGNIVEAEFTSDSWLYGYIMRVTYDENEERCTKLSIFSQTNQRVDLELGDKVVVDGVSRAITDLGMVGVKIIDFTNPTAPKAIRQLVRYRESDGRLTQLDTWTTYNPSLEDANALGSTKDSDLVGANGVSEYVVYYSKPKVFIPASSGPTPKDTDIYVGADSSTICFTIPATEDYANDESFYAAGGMNFGNGGGYTFGEQIDAYNINEAKIAKVFIRNMTNTYAPSGEQGILITDMSIVANENGEAAYKIEGIDLTKGEKYSKVASAENDISNNKYRPQVFFPTKQFGDVIYTYEQDRETEGEVIFSATSHVDLSLGYGLIREGNTDYTPMRAYTSGTNQNTYMGYNNEYVGKISWANDTHMRLESVGTNTSGEHESFSFAFSDATVYLVDIEAETVETIDTTRVASYTKDKVDNEDYLVHVYQSSGIVKQILIYTNFSARD